jgi:DNA-binding transcriptional ArsR family regulator
VEVEQEISDLRARVAALEGGHPVLDDRTDALEDPAGSVSYSGEARFGDDRLAWRRVHRVGDLLALDEAVLARQLTALASPVRIRILRELSAGALQTAELQARLDEPSAGQLYHHLRELLAAGIVTQPRRSVYAVPDRAVIPLLTLLACAHDLAS